MFKFSTNSQSILERRYLKKDDSGRIVESIEDRFRGIAREMAQAEIDHAEERIARLGIAPDSTVVKHEMEEACRRAAEFEEKYFQEMIQQKFMPNSPTISNAPTLPEKGTIPDRNRRLQYSACYVLPVEDSTPEIFDSLKVAAMIQKSGGGTGFSFSRLRPANDVVRTTMGVASGPVSFMKIFDSMTDVMKQGGTRRGANMGILECSHPDIMDFIRCKLSGGIENFNISVAATNEFMEALEKDEKYALRNPRNGEVVQMISAREVFNAIVEAAWKSGDPGLIFIDRINAGRSNPVPSMGPITATNPCGEQPLYGHEACNLGSINLSAFVNENGFDYTTLEETVTTAIRFLDSVITRNNYPTAKIDEVVKGNRRIGLGVMGWADALCKMAVPYDSPQALKLAEDVMSFIQETADWASYNLSMDRGPFPNYHDSIYAESHKGGPISKEQRRPLRNSTRTTIAPTGTISIIADCSSGIEPLYALAYKHTKQNLTFVHGELVKALQRAGKWNEQIKEAVLSTGSIQHLDVPQQLKDVFKTAHEIHWKHHVSMQASFQKFVDNAVSKTINLANSASAQDVAEAYIAAYREGCSGITVFRDGCKNTQVLVAGNHEEGTSSTMPQEELSKSVIKHRAEICDGSTYKAESPFGTVYLTVNSGEDGEPIEAFLNVGKAGSDVSADAEALGRLISLNLRLEPGTTPSERLEKMKQHLRGIGGSRTNGKFGPKQLKSIPDAVGYCLELHLERKSDKEEPTENVPSARTSPKSDAVQSHPKITGNAVAIADLCPECGCQLIKESGCATCYDCAFSNC